MVRGGDVFSFVMKHEGLTFPEAVKQLARRYGIVLPDRRMSPGQKRRLDEKEQVLAANRQAMDFFQQNLRVGPAGGKAREYLVKRALTQATIYGFHIGYAPQGWDNLLKHLLGQHLTSPVIEKSGLVVPRKNSGGFYDRFRDRIVFPIFDLNRQVIGFGGRVMDDALPKYLNSPETPVYNKSRSLYGLHLAKARCRETESVYIVEGYFDAIALHQHGLVNTVATLGTSLTAEHVRMLRGYIGEKGRAVLVYDSDEAGIKAARRSVEVFDKEYVNAQILVLDSGYDPDTFIFEKGAEAFHAAAAGAMDIIPFLLETAVKQNGLSVEGKVRVVSELQQPLTAVSDAIARSLYVRMVAERLEIDERALLEKLRQEAAKQTALKQRRRPAPESGAPEDVGKASTPVELTLRYNDRVEKQIIAMMMQVPQSCHIVKSLDALTLFENQSLSRIGHVILDAHSRVVKPVSADGAPAGPAEDQWLADIMGGLTTDEDRRIVVDVAMNAEGWTIEGCEKQILHFFETARKRRSQQDIEHRIKEAVRNKDDKLLEQLLSEKQTLAVKREKRKMALLDR